MMENRINYLLGILLCLAVISAAPVSQAGDAPADDLEPQKMSWTIIESYPHDPEAYTQGLVMDNGILYEGTGLNGRSSLRRVNLPDGRVLQVHDLPTSFFGEGIAVFGDKIFQLTWQSGFGFIYNRETFKLERVFTIKGEGWGITTDQTHLIVSDGTAALRFLDPVTMKEQRMITVTDRNGPVTRLNELEYIGGRIYANIYQNDNIVIIDPETGRVTGLVDLSGLREELPLVQQVDVLNGIAYDAVEDRLFVTGKLWPRLFHIRLVPVTENESGESR